MSQEEQEKPCGSTDPVPADVVDTGNAIHADRVQDLDPAADGNEPTVDAVDLQKKLIAAEEPLHSRTELSRLSFVKQMMELQARNNLSDKCIDALLELLCDVCPEGHKVPANVSECQKLLSDLNIPSFKTEGESSKRKRNHKTQK
ncbi:unnamed protein product [Alopecurus aequalis]